MTLVLSCLTQQFAIQVSDKRVTRIADGQLTDDKRNKGTQFCAQMAFAYSGLAELGGKNTDIWLAHTLALAPSLNEAVKIVCEKATEQFKQINCPNDIKRHAFVGVGWGKQSENAPLVPIHVTISNALNKNGAWLDTAKEEFEIDAVWLSSPFALRPPIGARVSDQDFDELRKNIRGCVEHETSPLEIVRLLGETIRKIATRNSQGSVGKNLLAIIVPKTSAQSNSFIFSAPLIPKGVNEFDGPTFMDIPADIDEATLHIPAFVCEGIVIDGGTFTVE